MTDSTAQHIATRDDGDLRARLVAAAEQAHIPQADVFVQMNLGWLIAVPVDGVTTITTAYAYAAKQRGVAVAALPPAPGINPAAVTDVHLAAAVQAVWGAVQPTAPGA